MRNQSNKTKSNLSIKFSIFLHAFSGVESPPFLAFTWGKRAQNTSSQWNVLHIKINHLRVTLKCEKVSLDLLCGSVEICKYANKSLPYIYLNLAVWKCGSVEICKYANESFGGVHE